MSASEQCWLNIRASPILRSPTRATNPGARQQSSVFLACDTASVGKRTPRSGLLRSLFPARSWRTRYRHARKPERSPTRTLLGRVWDARGGGGGSLSQRLSRVTPSYTCRYTAKPPALPRECTPVVYGRACARTPRSHGTSNTRDRFFIQNPARPRTKRPMRYFV